MDLEGIILHERSQRKTMLYDLIYIRNQKKIELLKTEQTGGCGGKGGNQTSNYNKVWRCTLEHGEYG